MSVKKAVKLLAVSNLQMREDASGVSVCLTETPFESIAQVI